MIELRTKQWQAMVFFHKIPNANENFSHICDLLAEERMLKISTHLNLNVLLIILGVLVFRRPRLLPFVNLLVGVPLRL